MTENERQLKAQLLHGQHHQWSQNSTTVELLRIIDFHREFLVGDMAAKCHVLEIDDAYFRQQASNIKTLSLVRALLTNSDLFVEKSIATQPKQ